MAWSREEKLSQIADLLANPAWQSFLLHWRQERVSDLEAVATALRAGHERQATYAQGKVDKDEYVLNWAEDMAQAMVHNDQIEWVEA